MGANMIRILKKPFAIVLAIIILLSASLVVFITLFNRSPISIDKSNSVMAKNKTVSLLNEKLTNALKDYSKNSIKDKYSNNDMFLPNPVAFKWKSYSCIRFCKNYPRTWVW